MTEIERDVLGKPKRISRQTSIAGVAAMVDRVYTYDDQQRLCKRFEPETGLTVYGYDSADNLEWSAHGRDRASCESSRQLALTERVNRAYDQRNRLTGITYPARTAQYPIATAPTNFSYWPDGTLKTISTPVIKLG